MIDKGTFSQNAILPTRAQTCLMGPKEVLEPTREPSIRGVCGRMSMPSLERRENNVVIVQGTLEDEKRGR